jgi:hypothetical protein
MNFVFVLMCVELIVALAIAGKMGPGRVTLQFDDYIYYGPLSTPAALTIQGLRLESSTGTFGGGTKAPGFDVFLFNTATFQK